MIGYIGMALLLISYLLLEQKNARNFMIVNVVASGLLTTHAVIINDLPFIVVNGFVTLVMLYKLKKGAR